MSDFNKCPVCKKRNLDIMLFDSNNRLICEKCKRAEDSAPAKINPPRNADTASGGSELDEAGE